MCLFLQTTILIDWLIGTSCYSAEVGQNYSEKKVEAVQDKQKVMNGLIRPMCKPAVRLFTVSDTQVVYVYQSDSFSNHCSL